MRGASTLPDLLDNIVVVLHEPRNGANIGAVVRALKNMGLRRLRLVRPAVFDPQLITTLAHRGDDVWLARQEFADLDAALADAVFVAGTSARPRDEAPAPLSPHAIAPELLRRAVAGPVVLLFGNEDNGLTNADLERCHALVTIPTDPSYSSLNLAQAVLLLAYELRRASTIAPPPTPAAGAAPATSALRAELAEAFRQLLYDIDFFKTPNEQAVLRRLGRLLLRADPNAREARLLLAILRALRERLT